MPSRCLNRVTLIGNLTRDPELRYTPAGMAVVSFGLATNRVWNTKQGERKEDAQFHRIVAWNKLAELCSQLLAKGRRAYVEGRIQYREWTDQDGQKKQVAEIVIDDMIVLDSNRSGGSAAEGPAMEYGEVEDAPMETEGESAVIDDIVIPDGDLGEISSEAPKDKVKKEKSEDKSDDKAEEEMPF